MKKLLAALALGVLAAVSLSAVAGAKTETRFTVIERQNSTRTSGHVFISRGTLLSHHAIVGHDVVKGNTRTGKIHAIARFRGEGSIKVQGRFVRHAGRRRNNRYIIIGGTGVFNGAAGKLHTHNLGNRHTRLRFIFVQ